jgi:hypothetical protein
LTAVVALAGSAPAFATDVDRIPIIDAPEGTPALGGGLRLSGAQFAGDDLDVDLVPLDLC